MLMLLRDSKLMRWKKKKKHDVNGSRRRTHALKARASRHSSLDSGVASGGDSDDPTSIGKDLALIIRHFSRFQKKSSSSPKKNYPSRHSSNSSQYRSSSRNLSVKDNSCFKCKKSGHFIVECPMWGIKHKSKHSHSNSSRKSYKSHKSFEPKKYDSTHRRKKRNDSDDDKKKKYHKKHEGSSLKYHSSRRSSSHRAKAYLGNGLQRRSLWIRS